MYGAIIGDIVGSKYEFNNIKTKDFPFVSDGCSFTDDTIMTVAVAKALLKSRELQKPFKPILVEEIKEMGHRFPHPQGGYGRRFLNWLNSDNPEPYNSLGNGSAMRVSPCGLLAVTLEEALALAKASAEVTHNHPEGIKGAQATAAAVFLARHWKSKDVIRFYINEFFYPLDFTLNEIRKHYHFDETCPGTVPQAIEAFLESDSFEDAIRNAVSLGGDSDTIGAITGSIAWSYYRFHNRTEPDSNAKEGRIWPISCEQIIAENKIDEILPKDFVELIDEFDIARMGRFGTFNRMGGCSPIPIEGCVASQATKK